MDRCPSPSVIRLLERIFPADIAAVLVGDLLEEHERRARSTSAGSVSLWFWTQILRSAVHLLCEAVGRGRWLLPLVIAFVAYAIVEAAEVAAVTVVAMIEPRTEAQMIAVLIVALGTLVLASCFAAWLRRGATTMLTLLVAVAAAAQVVAPTDAMPLWYRLLFLIAGPLAAAAGTALLARRCFRGSVFRRPTSGA